MINVINVNYKFYGRHGVSALKLKTPNPKPETQKKLFFPNTFERVRAVFHNCKCTFGQAHVFV